MLVVGIGTIIFVLLFVMPKIAVLFDGITSALPFATLAVMGLSRFLQHGWPFILIGSAVFLVAGKFAWKDPRVRQAVSGAVIAFPVIKEIALKFELERFTRTLGLLLDSGIPILRAFEIAIPTVANENLCKDLWLCHAQVTGGSPFGETLRALPWVPDIVAQMVVVGEESGELGRSLQDIADTYEQDIAETLKTATTLIEPLLILLVGAVVGFIVFAMLLPVFQMDLFSR
jgi:type II secretory pathway component PulF